MPITIRRAETEDDRHKVFRFRYAIYVQEMGRVQQYADHTARTIIEPFDDTGEMFIAEDGGEIVGTVRTNFGRNTDFRDYRELYGMECLGQYFPDYVSVSTKFMVARHHRKGTLAYRLATEGYKFGVGSGILFDFIDCNPHLEQTFQRLGYVRYRSRIQHPEYGDVLPLVLPLTDLDHLNSIASPWARICREHCPHLAGNRILRQTVRGFLTQQNTVAA